MTVKLLCMAATTTLQRRTQYTDVPLVAYIHFWFVAKTTAYDSFAHHLHINELEKSIGARA